MDMTIKINLLFRPGGKFQHIYVTKLFRKILMYSITCGFQSWSSCLWHWTIPLHW